nr:MAG TPA: hypothetical protein [Caudoviricetes sp.]
MSSFLHFSVLPSKIIPYIWEILKSNHYGKRSYTLTGCDQCVAGNSFRFYYRRPIESLCRDPRGTSESRY